MINALNWIRYIFISAGILLYLYLYVVPKYHFWLPVVMKKDKKDIAVELEHVGFGLNQINMHYHPHLYK